MRVHGAALVLGCLVVVGCVKAPVRNVETPGVPPPAEWTAGDAPADPIESDWWNQFDDPRLDRLVRLAVERNYDLQAAAARVSQAAAHARIAGADLEPSLSVGYEWIRQRQNFIGFPLPGSGQDVLSTKSTRQSPTLRVSWEVDLWGRLRAGARAALADAQATEAELRGARQSIAGRTLSLWFAVGEAQAQVELARDSAASFRRLSEQVRERYRRGVRPALDLRLALSNQAGAEAAIARREAQRDRALRQLEVLLGEYPGAALLEQFGTPELPPTPPAVPAGLPAELIGRRPDLVAAERRLAAADQRTLVAQRSLYPRLTLTGNGGTATDSLANLVDGNFQVWTLAAGLIQPLFQGGRLRAGVVLNRAASEETLARYAAAALQAYAEVETALAADEWLSDEERHLAEAAVQSVAAERLAEDRYRRGVGSYLAVLESQTRSFNASSQLVELRRRRLDNRVDLHLALGGGFEPETQADADATATVAVLEEVER